MLFFSQIWSYFQTPVFKRSHLIQLLKLKIQQVHPFNIYFFNSSRGGRRERVILPFGAASILRTMDAFPMDLPFQCFSFSNLLQLAFDFVGRLCQLLPLLNFWTLCCTLRGLVLLHLSCGQLLLLKLRRRLHPGVIVYHQEILILLPHCHEWIRISFGTALEGCTSAEWRRGLY